MWGVGVGVGVGGGVGVGWGGWWGGGGVGWGGGGGGGGGGGSLITQYLHNGLCLYCGLYKVKTQLFYDSGHIRTPPIQ